MARASQTCCRTMPSPWCGSRKSYRPGSGAEHESRARADEEKRMTAACWLRWRGAIGVAAGVVAASPAFGQGKAAGTKKGAVEAPVNAAAREEANRLTREVEKLYAEGKYD